MTPRAVIIRALQILALAAALVALGHAMGWVDEMDRQVEQASLESYCTGVATWQAEAARGIRPEHRTGHPDYRNTAAEHCPGLRPAGPAVDQSTERQLAHH